MADSGNDQKVSFYKPLKRFVIPIKDFHIPKKLFNIFKNNKYEFRINYNFETIIKLCQKVRRRISQSWI